ncbi:hypothetical protein Sbs19_40700 [Sphingobium sp. BS19]|nr:hypothetical protein Sbs19_40700 [Sphingobium sp. BS19]
MLVIRRQFNKVADTGCHCVRRCRDAAMFDIRAGADAHDVSNRERWRANVAVTRRAPPQQGQTVGSKRGR